MSAGDLAVCCFARVVSTSRPSVFLSYKPGSVNAFRLTMRAADVGESPRFLGSVLNFSGFPFLSLVLSRRS